jgi:hypothetical protein
MTTPILFEVITPALMFRSSRKLSKESKDATLQNECLEASIPTQAAADVIIGESLRDRVRYTNLQVTVM